MTAPRPRDDGRRVRVTFRLNGEEVAASVPPWARLLDVLRGPLGRKGAKEGCGEGMCGACTVMVDGRSVNACLFPVLEAEGREVLTVEGLEGPGGALSILQEEFVDGGGIQCGFCTPGMLLSSRALLDGNRDPTEEEIRETLAGNLCRCTGYIPIVAAVRRAAARERAAREEAS